MKQLYPLFQRYTKTLQLIDPGDTIFLAFSGGKDSVTLFYLLKRMQKEIDFILKAAYFNHKIRTDFSEEEKWVISFCQARETELIIGSKDVMAFKTREKLNLEHAASISRYEFFMEISSKHKNTKIATAHTRSDLTETFFIKLLRGSGLQGLSSIFSKKKNTIIRPLLLFSQEEIKDFLNRNKIPYYNDYSNQQDEFLRNRIRKYLVPEIEKIEPEINQQIFKTVSIIQEEYDYFSRKATTILIEGLLLGKVFPIRLLNHHHLAIQRHIIREYIRKIKGNLLNIDFGHIEAIRKGHSIKKGLAIPGLELIFRKGYIFPVRFSIPVFKYTIPSDKSISLNEIEGKLTFRKTTTYKKPRDNQSIIVPIGRLQFPLTIRNPLKEDRYIKIHSNVNQKIFEMIRSSGMPSGLRNLCPVLVNKDGRLIWVKGSPIANEFRVSKKKDGVYLVISVT